MILLSDQGGEYLSYNFQHYLKKNEILSQCTPPRTPQHNEVSERRIVLYDELCRPSTFFLVL
jgi:transposase InsO family protein